MLIVVAVLVALLAILFPAVSALRARQAVQATTALLQTVATSASDSRLGVVQLVIDGQIRAHLAGDINSDGIIDGDPARDPALSAFTAAAERAQYRGAAAHWGLSLPRRHLDPEGRIVDSWGQPLRLLRPNPSGEQAAVQAGVWSLGPDGEADTEDDLFSWKDPAP